MSGDPNTPTDAVSPCPRPGRGAGRIDLSVMEGLSLEDPAEAEFIASLEQRTAARPASGTVIITQTERDSVSTKTDDAKRFSSPASGPSPGPPAPTLPTRSDVVDGVVVHSPEDVVTEERGRGKISLPTLRQRNSKRKQLHLPKDYHRILAMALKENFSDMLEYLSSCIYRAGRDNLGRDIIVIVASAVGGKAIDLKRLLLYFVRVMDPVVEKHYTLVYCHSKLLRHNIPSHTIMRQVYGIFNRKYKKNLKALYVIHPTFFVKTTAKLFKPFISSKFWKKLVYVKNVTDIYDYMKPNQLKLPDDVMAYRAKGGSVARPLFGVPLEEALEIYPTESGIPIVCETAIEYLEDNALDVEGIFRIPGANSAINRLKRDFDRGEEVNLSGPSGEPHVVAGLLKLYLRELPEPVIPFEAYTHFIAVQRKYKEYDAMKPYLIRLLHALSDVTQQLLRHLFGLLHLVIQHQDNNKMSLSNLAIVFGPNLMRSVGDDVAAALSDAGAINNIMKMLIENYVELFLAEESTEGTEEGDEESSK